MMEEGTLGRHVGRYRLVKMVLGGADVSKAYADGWADKSLYMFFEITADGRLLLTAHTAVAEKVYEYYLDPADMRYHLTADLSDEGTPITIEDGVLTEETADHLMVYELTDELD